MEAGASDFTPEDLAEAREAADRFLQAVEQGDETTARALLVPIEGESMDFNSMHESTTGYELAEPQAEGEQVLVEAKVSGAAMGEGEPPVQNLPLILRPVDGAWKVDMGASINRMLGVNLGDVMSQMAQGLGDAMSKGMEAVAEGFGALSPPEGDEESFREALLPVRQAILPEETARMSETLGKPLDVVVAWYSMGRSADAVNCLNSLVLGQLGEAIRLVSEDADEREKLQGALDRVVIRHVNVPEQRVCVLDGGQLELAVCLVDCPGHENEPGFYVSDEIADVLRQAIQ